ncbi:hypothetical protein Pmani_019493 [Petrolisthes manimaculis]|uniref:Uncharacterized protein n=1 Tax=Petrolisthes manimaculis TaxID=1843537 RepID=A0AAE1PJF9_9EUCA|nr:hypothetical protein Pmani_019493 [Petrolisthes manimaculis]
MGSVSAVIAVECAVIAYVALFAGIFQLVQSPAEQAVERDERARERDKEREDKEREFQLAKLAAETELARVNSQVPTLHTNEPSSGTIAVVEDEPVDDQFPLAEAVDVSSGDSSSCSPVSTYHSDSLSCSPVSPYHSETLRATHQSRSINFTEFDPTTNGHTS